jgi:hypothetical protein
MWNTANDATAKIRALVTAIRASRAVLFDFILSFSLFWFCRLRGAPERAPSDQEKRVLDKFGRWVRSSNCTDGAELYHKVEGKQSICLHFLDNSVKEFISNYIRRAFGKASTQQRGPGLPEA